MSAEETAQTEERVPIYRVKNDQRFLMGWARRNKDLRGAKEIRLQDKSGDVVYAESDA